MYNKIMKHSILTEALYDGLDYNAISSKVLNQTNEFRRKAGILEFDNKTEADIAVSIMEDNYPNVELVEADNYYQILYNRLNQEESFDVNGVNWEENKNPAGTPLGNWGGAGGFAEDLEEDIERYSDVVPKEQRKYWYFTTHGVGPGSIPKGVNVLDTKDGKNNKGTRGTFVCLDAVLNTDELKKYDMKEMKPTNESLNERFNEAEYEVIKYSAYDNNDNYIVQNTSKNSAISACKKNGGKEVEAACWYDRKDYNNHKPADKFFVVYTNKNESLEENLEQSKNDANDICAYLDKNLPELWYDLADYDEAPMDTSIVSIIIEGDWKHDHLAFKDAIQDWAEENDRYIFKIDEEEIGESDSDWYNSRYDIYITKDKESFDTLNSMKALFSESLNEDVVNPQLAAAERFCNYSNKKIGGKGYSDKFEIESDENGGYIVSWGREDSYHFKNDGTVEYEYGYYDDQKIENWDSIEEFEKETYSQDESLNEGVKKLYNFKITPIQGKWGIECKERMNNYGKRYTRNLYLKSRKKSGEPIWCIDHSYQERYTKGTAEKILAEIKDKWSTINESVEKHDTLNQKIFNGDELDPEVKDKLLEIVDNFSNALKQDGVKLDIKDVRIIGSNASYNYTSQSDIDLHIYADLSVYPDHEALAEKVYNAYKSLWNNKYDPVIKGHQVEIYVEPYEE